MDVVKYLEKKSENNPKDNAQAKKDERRQQHALKEKAKPKKKKGISLVVFIWFESIINFSLLYFM